MKWLAPVIALICFFLDLNLKSWAKANLVLSARKVFIPGLINLTLTTNTGCAFGLGKQFGPFMTLLAISIFTMIYIWFLKKERAIHSVNSIERIGFGFLAGGALGNICERLIYGRVTDFLEFSFMDFPVFNFADICIDIGAVLILENVLFKKRDS